MNNRLLLGMVFGAAAIVVIFFFISPMLRQTFTTHSTNQDNHSLSDISNPEQITLQQQQHLTTIRTENLTATVDSMTFTLTKISFTHSIKTAAGQVNATKGRFLVFSITTENYAARQRLMSVNNFALVDNSSNEGVEYRSDLIQYDALTGDTVDLITPGSTSYEQVPFDVPSDMRNYTLIISGTGTGDTFTGIAFIRLGTTI